MEIINSKDSDETIYVPALDLNFDRYRTLLEENWYGVHKKLQSQGKRMPTLPEFLEFLKYTKVNFQYTYKSITEESVLSHGEWIDAFFEKRGKNLYINYNHVIDKNGNLVPKNSEIIEEGTLMKDKASEPHQYFFRVWKEPRLERISLDDYANNNHTSQGLPHKKVRLGNFNYICPKIDRDSVAMFSFNPDNSKKASIDCNVNPLSEHEDFGVYAIRIK
jgi:hypothetical protein